jgi:SnoaL-like polyketide cyclase
MKLLLASGGVTNPSIRDALVDLPGKLTADATALCIPTEQWGHTMCGPVSARGFVSGRGTYTDPTVPNTPLSGSALEEHVRVVFSVPGSENAPSQRSGQRSRPQRPQWWGRCLMRGTHAGRLHGLPPLGGSLAHPGVDLITVENGKIVAVERHFDRQTMADQANVVRDPRGGRREMSLRG